MTTSTLRLKTNLNCGSCVAAVKPYLDGDPAISRWEVDTATPDKVLTVEGAGVVRETVKAAVARAGFKVLGDARPAQVGPLEVHPPEDLRPVTYYPLGLLLAFLGGVVGLVEFRTGGFVWERAMSHFMGAFFLGFSFFKLLDLPGFAASYRMYDVVARRVPAYGYVYPFVELLLGIAYVTGFQPIAANVVTLVVMSVGAVGVLQSLLAKRRIRCACLGTVFNLPMSTVTLVEDGLMVAMAAAMILLGSHSVDGQSLPAHTVAGPAPHHQSLGN